MPYRRPALSIAALALVGAAAGAHAEPEKPLGEETRGWLLLQQGGTQASGASRPMPGDIADNVYQRYADSFKLPIPAEFKRQTSDQSENESGR